MLLGLAGKTIGFDSLARPILVWPLGLASKAIGLVIQSYPFALDLVVEPDLIFLGLVVKPDHKEP
jgi:hypothetical protein